MRFNHSCRLAEVQVCSLYMFLLVSGVSVCSLHVRLRVFRPPEPPLSPPEAQRKPNGDPERPTEPPRGPPEVPQSSPDSPQRPPEAQQRPTDAQKRQEEAHSGPHSPSKAARVHNLCGFSRVFTCIFKVSLGAARAQLTHVFTCFFEGPCVIYTGFYGILGQAPDGPGQLRTAPDMPGRPRRSPRVPWSLPTKPFV